MGIFSNILNRKTTVQQTTTNNNSKYSISSPKLNILESLKSEVTKSDQVGFSKDVGEAHPFDLEAAEQLFLHVPIVSGVVTKYVDFVIGPGFHTKSDDERAKAIIDQWMQDVNFNSLVRKWLKEALIKGTGYMELGGSVNEPPQGVKVINATNMFIKRDKSGMIEEYNQVIGSKSRLSKTKKISFKPFQIAHISLNTTGDNPYGYGIISPTFRVLDSLIGAEKSLHVLMKRKANVPLIATLGDNEGTPASSAEIESVGNLLQTLKDKTEFAVGAGVSLSTVDFGNIGDKFETLLKHDIDMLVFGYQVPEVLLGRGSIPEGLAQVQMDAFERRINSIQVELEKVIENKIFRRVLQGNGLDVHVELDWGMPSNAETNSRITTVTGLLQNAFLSMSMRHALERELATLLGFDPDEVLDDDEEREREEEQPQPLVPGSNSREEEKTSTHVCEDTQSLTHLEELSAADLKEWIGFNYEEYLRDILQQIEKDDFSSLMASTDDEILAGRLQEKQIIKLKRILSEEFGTGGSINDIARRIEEDARVRDLFRTKDGKLVLNANGDKILAARARSRSINIARTETIRLANKGAMNNYKTGGVTQYRWLATMSDRTCPICEALNGVVFDVSESGAILSESLSTMPPAHNMCRCTVVPITDLEGI
jgi:SPP1 gp7 family putative phage head morphogenesis protein